MYRNVRVIPRQLLEQLYVEKQWSVREVAEYFQCSVDTIMRRMKQYDIERRPLKKDINMVHVQALYETGKWSAYTNGYQVKTASSYNRAGNGVANVFSTNKILFGENVPMVSVNA